MPITFKPVPAHWMDACARMTLLDENEKAELREHGHAVFHHGIGRTIRNEWKLWDEKSPLHQSFRERFGLWHADDMSGILLQSAERCAHGEDFDFAVVQQWAQEYKDYWNKMDRS